MQAERPHEIHAHLSASVQKDKESSQRLEYNAAEGISDRLAGRSREVSETVSFRITF